MLASSACVAGTLSFSPSAALFGNVPEKSSKVISVTITNTGTASVALGKESLQASVMYSVIGLTLPKTLVPGAHITFMVKFTPLETGSFGGHAVFGVAGYNVYRAMLPDTAYAKVISALVTGTSYLDKSVIEGASYTYEVTAVDTKGGESKPSNVASVTIP